MIKKQIFIITIATLLTILAWVVFDILHKRQQVIVAPNVQEKLEPLNPEFDLESI